MRSSCDGAMGPGFAGEARGGLPKEFFTELWRAAVSKSLPLRHQGTHRALIRLARY
jgi:hypothetical protein